MSRHQVGRFRCSRLRWSCAWDLFLPLFKHILSFIISQHFQCGNVSARPWRRCWLTTVVIFIMGDTRHGAAAMQAESPKETGEQWLEGLEWRLASWSLIKICKELLYKHISNQTYFEINMISKCEEKDKDKNSCTPSWLISCHKLVLM